MPAVLRTALPADLEAIMHLERSGFGPGIVETQEVFARRLESFAEGFLVAQDDQEAPWGYFCSEIWSGWSLGDEDRFDLGHDVTAWHTQTGKTLYIASMTVGSHRRGSGLGRWLFHHSLSTMMERFPRLEEAVLLVHEGWAPARRIYQTEGFVVVGKKPAFFKEWGRVPVDALVLARSLRK